MDNKPIVRWTVGRCADEGLESLNYAIKSWRKVFKNKFVMFACYNNLSSEKINLVSKLGVELVNQEEYTQELIYPPFDTAWKLYPPRINIKSHEIFIDNDLIIYKSLSEIEEFLEKKDLIIVAAAHRRFYGRFDKLVKSDWKINTGFFGLPPGFNLGFKLNKLLNSLRHQWSDHLDESGAISVLIEKQKTKIIAMETLYICNPNHDFAPYRIGTCGTHFAALNDGKNKYWNIFNEFYPPPI